MRNLSSVGHPSLTAEEQEALRLVADGLGPRDIASRLGMSEESLYRLVTWVLDELEPGPGGRRVADVHAEQGSRAATAMELEEFEQLYGRPLEADHEG